MDNGKGKVQSQAMYFIVCIIDNVKNSIVSSTGDRSRWG